MKLPFSAGRHAELAKHLARSEFAPSPLPWRSAPDPSGLKVPQDDSEFVGFLKLTHHQLRLGAERPGDSHYCTVPSKSVGGSGVLSSCTM